MNKTFFDKYFYEIDCKPNCFKKWLYAIVSVFLLMILTKNKPNFLRYEVGLNNFLIYLGSNKQFPRGI